MEAFVLLGIPGWSQILLIVIALLLLFGGKKIPELMRGIGLGMKEFKNATNDDEPSEKAEGNKLEDSKE